MMMRLAPFRAPLFSAHARAQQSITVALQPPREERSARKENSLFIEICTCKVFANE